MKAITLFCLLFSFPCLSLAETSDETTSTDIGSEAFGIPYERYAGVNFGELDIDKDNMPDLDHSFDVLGGRLGVRAYDMLDAELRLSRALTSDTQVVDKAKVTSELDYLLGTYLKLGIGETFHPYLLLGYNQISFSSGSTNREAANAVEDIGGDIATGLGIELKITNYGRRVTLTLECTDYYDKDSAQLSGCQFGAIAWF